MVLRIYYNYNIIIYHETIILNLYIAICVAHLLIGKITTILYYRKCEEFLNRTIFGICLQIFIRLHITVSSCSYLLLLLHLHMRINIEDTAFLGFLSDPVVLQRPFIVFFERRSRRRDGTGQRKCRSPSASALTHVFSNSANYLAV